MYVHACINMCIHIHVYIYIYIHTHARAHTNKHTHANAHSHTHIHTPGADMNARMEDMGFLLQRVITGQVP